MYATLQRTWNDRSLLWGTYNWIFDRGKQHMDAREKGTGEYATESVRCLTSWKTYIWKWDLKEVKSWQDWEARPKLALGKPLRVGRKGKNWAKYFMAHSSHSTLSLSVIAQNISFDGVSRNWTVFDATLRPVWQNKNRDDRRKEQLAERTDS